MAAKLTNEEILGWYYTFQDFKNRDIGGVAYCKEHDLDYKKFCNMKYRIIFKRDSNPEVHEKYITHVYASEHHHGKLKQYCKSHGLDKATLMDARSHVKYLQKIDKLLKEVTPEQEPEMQFVPLKANAPAPPLAVSEIIEPKNDIELTITKGVRVSISPEMDTSKIIRIIELLKDL